MIKIELTSDEYSLIQEALQNEIEACYANLTYEEEYSDVIKKLQALSVKLEDAKGA